MAYFIFFHGVWTIIGTLIMFAVVPLSGKLTEGQKMLVIVALGPTMILCSGVAMLGGFCGRVWRSLK